MAKTAQATKEVAKQKKGKQEDTSHQSAKKQAQSVEFSEVNETETKAAGASIDILLDMDIPVTVAIGRVEMPVRRLLQLGPGSVLKLDKTIDAPVDLYMKQTRFATGTVVVVDDRFAVRIKQIIGIDKAVQDVSGT
ncbi:MAG: FliM/FliN family flagellar motor switch protein [Phycisphaerales bacterium]|nr:MAG: FliM/FliN family flagellar motor switch protein [Phycisphaerales bacterium]